eukprot:TRINITY_DN64709_c0_g1_i1.p1 TRINITY_DN64709_c0_g1~~TRINITY_DN64709_c0_g1_i1.p1  ORF type:complete len:203 (+),score=26.09 TRINITY_DN64709_c0_g1_i1:57-611(+)
MEAEELPNLVLDPKAKAETVHCQPNCPTVDWGGLAEKKPDSLDRILHMYISDENLWDFGCREVTDDKEADTQTAFFHLLYHQHSHEVHHEPNLTASSLHMSEEDLWDIASGDVNDETDFVGGYHDEKLGGGDACFICLRLRSKSKVARIPSAFLIVKSPEIVHVLQLFLKSHMIHLRWLWSWTL